MAGKLFMESLEIFLKYSKLYVEGLLVVEVKIKLSL
jgi:hypothetical protein